MDERGKSALIALFVTFLWSSSWVLIKYGLEEIPPLFFASLRYLIAGFLLLVFSLLHPPTKSDYSKLTKKWWFILLIYGLVFITSTQGLQFVILEYFPAITLSFVLNFTSIVVILLSVPLLREFPTKIQLILIIIAMLGGTIYFYPFNLNEYSISYLLLIFILLSNGLSSIIGRKVNKEGLINPIVITSVSMSFGAVILLIFAISQENLPKLSLSNYLIIIWLAVVNTAFAFTLWNYAMKHLRAFEITVINNTMLPQITILALIFLDERPTPLQWFALAIIIITSYFVQIKGAEKTK